MTLSLRAGSCTNTSLLKYVIIWFTPSSSSCTIAEYCLSSTQNRRLRKQNSLRWPTWGFWDLARSRWNQSCPFIFSQCAVSWAVSHKYQVPSHLRPWTWDLLSLEFISSFYLILNNSYWVCVPQLKHPLPKVQSHITFQVELNNPMLLIKFLWCPLLVFTAMVGF